MAPKKSPTKTGNALVIVESPKKAKTIARFLGKGYTVEASVGHIRDLPRGKPQVPEKFKNEEWAELGVNVDEGFQPLYVVPPEKKKQVSVLKKLLKDCDELYLATDEDREGEAISWHLLELLSPKVPVHRLVFHEITQEAISNALESPRQIDGDLVRAQETRRILDRLIGYPVSRLLWSKVRAGLTAGRVQSVALRMVVDRERQRLEFRPSSWWDLVAQFSTQGGESFDAQLKSVDGKRIPSGEDFDKKTGKLTSENVLILDETGAKDLAEKLNQTEFKITAVKETQFTTKPRPPFMTTSMQTEANRKLGFASRRTMRAAQSLYEDGHITYMRTDSTSLATVAVDAARELVRSEYGEDYLPDEPRTYSKKVKNAQEAHEAIRPAGHPFEKPEAIRSKVTPDDFKLFELVWKRTIASQMKDAKGRRISVTIEGGGAVFTASGKVIDFPGFLRAYVEGSDNPDAELADQERLLPDMSANDRVNADKLESKFHQTQPPARYNEPTLTEELESRGIGRPSTYASIFETLYNREYVYKKGKALVPAWVGFSVIRLLEEHLGELVDYQFTANMEDFLDSISRGEAESVQYLKQFYHGEDDAGLKGQLKAKREEIDPAVINRLLIGKPEEGEHTGEIFIRVGKRNVWLEQGEGDDQRTANVPDDLAPDELTVPKALELFEQSAKGDEPIGQNEEGRDVYIKTGRFGPYIQLAPLDPESGEAPKNASLLKDMTIDEVDLETALKLLTLPRDLGQHPELKESIVAANGRYGPYIKCGKETRSLPAEESPIDVTIEKAIELLAQPKARGRQAQRKVLKTFDVSPVTEKPIELLEGRYGPYVADGETNASLPKAADPETLTFDEAVTLLAERAAKGGGKKKKKKKKKAAKKKKKAAKKKATKKKASKKKTAKKNPAAD